MENSVMESRETPGAVNCAPISESESRESEKKQPDWSDPQKQPERPILPERQDRPAGDAGKFRKYGPAAALFAALFAAGVYDNPGGIAFSVPVAAFFLILEHVRRGDGGDAFAAAAGGKKGLQRFLAACAVLLSVNVWTSASVPLQLLDKCGILILGAVFLLRSTRDDSDDDPGTYLGGIVRVLFRPLAKLPGPFGDLAQYLKERRKDGKSGRAAAAIGKGVLIAVPLLVVILGLLAGADSVFESMLDDLLINVEIPDLAADLVKIAVTAAAGLISFYVWAADSGEKGAFDEGGGKTRGKGNALTAITFLLPLTVVYTVFCGIQAVYLTGGRSLPDGISYWEYAHAGFYQLAAVCAINFILVVLCQVRYPRHRFLTGLLFFMTLGTYIMIASSAARMILYIREYDLTFLRLFVLWFLAVLAVWLLVVLAAILRGGVSIFRYCLAAITVLYLLFAFARPDYWIARYNIAAADLRIAAGQSFDGAGPDGSGIADNLDRHYLCAELSDDAVPALAGYPVLLEERKDYGAWEREQRGEMSLLNAARTWNLSGYVAERLMDKGR